MCSACAKMSLPACYEHQERDGLPHADRLITGFKEGHHTQCALRQQLWAPPSEPSSPSWLYPARLCLSCKYAVTLRADGGTALTCACIHPITYLTWPVRRLQGHSQPQVQCPCPGCLHSQHKLSSKEYWRARRTATCSMSYLYVAQGPHLLAKTCTGIVTRSPCKSCCACSAAFHSLTCMSCQPRP